MHYGRASTESCFSSFSFIFFFDCIPVCLSFISWLEPVNVNELRRARGQAFTFFLLCRDRYKGSMHTRDCIDIGGKLGRVRDDISDLLLFYFLFWLGKRDIVGICVVLSSDFLGKEGSITSCWEILVTDMVESSRRSSHITGWPCCGSDMGVWHGGSAESFIRILKLR